MNKILSFIFHSSLVLSFFYDILAPLEKLFSFHTATLPASPAI